MSFSYDWTGNPTVAQVRMMVGDTVNTVQVPAIWQDEEIQGALNANNSQNIIVALSGYRPAVPQTFSFGRTAAMLLRGLGAAKAAIVVSRALDVNVAPAAAASALDKLAQSIIDQENSAGFFAVAEMGNSQFWYRERLYNMLLRINA